MADTVAVDVRDKVVVVTGGARGMGAAYVRGFLAKGARVVATDRSWSGADQFKEELRAFDKNVLLLAMDVTDGAQIDHVYQATLDRFGTVDVLLNNAAMRMRDLYPPSGRVETLLDTSDEDWLALYGVNVFGALKVIRRFIKPMIEQRRGSVISVVSSGMLFHSHGGGYQALRPESKEQPYMSSKAALANLTFYLAADMNQYNIAANIAVPGHTRTTGFDEQNRARMAAGARPSRLPVVPEHMLPLVLFLAAQDATGVTGKMFDALTWNAEHGFGSEERWLDRSVSYPELVSQDAR
jgi:NAD(P)-dependent dehydrogenase (short-subunit alcohol dehydrogenase family)